MIGVPLVVEGDAFVTVGYGFAVTTRATCSRSIRIPTRQPSRGAFARIEMHTVMWLKGDRWEPITTAHPDGYMGFPPITAS